MASCVDDCLYYKVCSDFRGNICDRDLYRFIDYRMTSDGLCKHFKNKADVMEVKHGYWIKGKLIGINVPQYTCSECGKWEDAEFPYCNCGVKMDGTPKNEEEKNNDVFK